MEKRKLIIISFLFLFVFTAQAQLIMIDSETGEFKYEDVVEANGISGTQLFERAKKWIDLYYKDNKMHVDSTHSLKKLVVFPFSWKFISKRIDINLIYDLEIRTKDNKYKYTISNFRIGKVYPDGEIDAITLKRYIDRFPLKYQIFIEEPVDTEITGAIESLRKYLLTEKFIEEEDDW